VGAEYLRKNKNPAYWRIVMEIKTIKSPTIQKAVYEELIDALLSGRIAPGEKITIAGLAASMGVSFMPVRGALQKLEAENFITVGSNRRIIVTELTSENLLELLEIRLILECLAAEKACRIRSEDSLVQLEKLNEQCANAKDADAYLLANKEFHQAIYSQAKMPMLDETINSLWRRFSPYLRILLSYEEDFAGGNFNTSHIGILKALRNKDEKAIKKWLTKDLTEAAKFVSRRLKKEKMAGEKD
jgi:DNA-binding GntR family transcriptional regulator